MIHVQVETTIRFGTSSFLLIEISLVHMYGQGSSPHNINRESGIEIPEARMPEIKKNNTTTEKWHNSRLPREQLLPGTMEQWEDRNVPITADLHDITDAVQQVDPTA